MTADFVKTLRGVKDTLATAKRPTGVELITAINQLIDLLSGMAHAMEQLERRNKELEERKGNSHGGNVSIRRSGTRSPGAG